MRKREGLRVEKERGFKGWEYVMSVHLQYHLLLPLIVKRILESRHLRDKGLRVENMSCQYRLQHHLLLLLVSNALILSCCMRGYRSF